MPATPDLPAWIAVALLSEEVIRRLPAAVRSPRSRTLWAAFFLFDVSLATKIQSVGDAIYRLTGVDDAATLVKHLVGIAAIAALLRWVIRVVPGRLDGRREPTYRLAISSAPRRIITWAAVVAITAIFPFSQRRTGNQEDTDFIFVQAGHLWGSLHLLLFYAYQVFGLVCASMMCLAASREPSAKGSFKYGMQMLSTGCAVGSLYSILRCGYLIARLCDKPFLGGDGFVDVASSFFLDGCVILVICGISAPKWERADHLIKAHGAVNDLRPLWNRLTRVVPTVIYAAQTGHRRPTLLNALRGRAADFWNWRHLDLRLRRRINEILDASLALAPYVPPTLRGQAEAAARELGLPPHVVTAYLLHAAACRKKAGEDPFDAQVEPVLQAEPDLFLTTARLLPIGHAMTDSVQMGILNRRIASSTHA